MIRKQIVMNSSLSPQEIKVLVLMCKGLTNKGIADKIFISKNTVMRHKQNIKEKLNNASVPALTAYAIRQGYVELSEIEAVH